MRKPKHSLEKVLDLLRKPDARLVRLHSNNGGRGFYVWPNGGRVSDDIAQLLLGRNDIQPYDNGLFPGHPQSWRLGNWRDLGRGGPVSAERPSIISRADTSAPSWPIRRGSTSPIPSAVRGGLPRGITRS